MTNTQNSMEDTMEKLRKELRVTRFFSMVSTILMLCILIGGFTVCNRAVEYVRQIEPIMEQLSTVDFEAINDAVVMLEESLATVDWQYLSQQVETLDVDAINEAVATLDTEELNKSMENLNEVADTLQKVSDSLKSFGSRFGF